MSFIFDKLALPPLNKRFKVSKYDLNHFLSLSRAKDRLKGA